MNLYRENLHHDTKLYQELDNQQVTLLYEYFVLQENIEYQDHQLVMMVEYLNKEMFFNQIIDRFCFSYHIH